MCAHICWLVSSRNLCWQAESDKSTLLTTPSVPTAFILYRQHHQAGVVHKYPGLANPDISKIIGEHWREENDETKNYWKRLAEEEKARHQRQYPQYKYQPRRGGKNGPAARAATAAGAGEDPGRCPKCGGRHISTPRTPSTPFGGIPGPDHGFGPISAAAMQPFITNNPRVIETVQQQHSQYRQPVDSQHGSMVDPRRQSSYYPLPPEPLRPIEEEYDASLPPGKSRRRGPQQDDFDIVTSPELKRRRFDPYPDRGSPMGAMPQHRGQQQQQQQQYPVMGGQVPYPQYQMQQHQQQQQQLQQHHYSLPRRGSSVSVGGSVYSNPPSSTGSGNYPTAPLPHPRTPGDPQPQQQPQQQQQQHHQQPQPQQPQPQGRDTGMAPPPRPSRLSTTSGVPPPPPGLPVTQSAKGPNFDESLTLAPLQIPSSPAQASATSDGARSLSGSGPSGLGMESTQQQQMLVQRGDSQARGIEAMVMSIPYMNKLDVLRKISPALGPPGAGNPGVETRGPVIAIEGGHVALMSEVRPMIERALRVSGECDVRVWADSSVDRASPPPAVVVVGEAGSVQKPSEQGGDVEMADTRDKLSVAGGSRHGSLSGASREGSKTPTPRQPGAGSVATPAPSTSTLDYLQTIVEWHNNSAEIVKHVTSKPSAADATATPVALIPGGFSLTLSDRYASTVAITDPYSPVDHWQWMATLWRGIVGPDLVIYVRQMTAEEAVRNSGTVEYRAPGVMVVRVAGEKVDEKTERRLAFEVMEWVRAGSFREGYSLGGEGH